MIDDTELLRDYVNGSEAAFAEFVRRHVALVYGAALRRVGHDHMLAEEVAQTVFTQCARKARALQSHSALSGWLHRSTRFAAIDALRATRQRIDAEQSKYMPNDPTPVITADDIRPIIDALLDRLSERDRDAVVLRFFESGSFAEIGRRLHISEDAARMRVERALENCARRSRAAGSLPQPPRSISFSVIRSRPQLPQRSPARSALRLSRPPRRAARAPQQRAPLFSCTKSTLE